MDTPLAAHSFNETRYYLMATACGACGKGPWGIDPPQTPPDRDGMAVVEAHCEHCGRRHAFHFRCDSSTPAGGTAEQINPTDQPSRIIDLAQWLSLFYMLVESAASTNDKAATRGKGFQAALCLAEALKFYGNDELPRESAFFTEKTLAVFREHPENFARQRLRDMQVKLPALPKMARQVARDRQFARKRWWEFWK